MATTETRRIQSRLPIARPLSRAHHQQAPAKRRPSWPIGFVHGVAEALPISSSAHAGTLYAAFGGPDSGPQRKTFEVALHAGSVLAISASRVAQGRRLLGASPAAAIASAVPPAVVGSAFESQIENRLGGKACTAIGLIGGSIALLATDRSPEERSADDAKLVHWLIVGSSQVAALWPGVSRSGAALAAARALRFRREDALELSEICALPITGGAVALKSARLAGDPQCREELTSTAVAVAASAAATAAARPMARRLIARHGVLPLVIYRTLFAASLLLARCRSPRS